MALNAGLTPVQISERLHQLLCPKCGERLHVLIGREWASCECCGVDYARADEAGRPVVLSRYLPDGAPSCPHYRGV